ncbi:MAG: hypothetical protein V1793_25010 [Pseudomonadota bacterium]
MVKKKEVITITPPNFQRISIVLEGTAPLMQARFSAKSMQAMMAKQAAGSTANKGKKREPRDFDDDFKQAMHVSSEGWIGVPAAALRNACIDVCRMVGFKMTHAKMSIFVEANGNDVVDGQPLVKLDAPYPEKTEMATRNATGVADIRVRPMWREWKLPVTFRYDADQFTANDVVNLVARAGEQIGLGEGRPYSKSSNGMGYGTFRIVQ